MLIQLVKNNLPRFFALLISSFMLLWAAGCPATVASPLRPDTKLTRAEMQIELDTLLATYQNRLTSLDEEERLRKLILQNAFVIAQAGSVNPLSILTTLLAFYGAGSGVQTATKAVKKKLAAG